jgi:hypothetical protein
MNYKRVRLAEDKLDHIIRYATFLDGSVKSLCGKTPWPGRWTEAEGHMPRVVCVDCKDKYGRQRG